MKPRVFKCKGMFDGFNFIENAALAVKGDSIIYAGAASGLPESCRTGGSVLECEFIIPGLFDSHAHLFLDPEEDSYSTLTDSPFSVAECTAGAIGHAASLLRAGVTSIRDLGAPFDLNNRLRDLIERGICIGPRISSAGSVIAVTGGHGANISLTCDGPAEMRKGVRKQAAAGADLIKLMVTGSINAPGMEPGAPVFTEEEVRAAASAARALGRKTAVHATGTTGISYSIDAGVDSIEHGVFLTPELIQKMADRKIFLVPTLSAPYHASVEGLRLNPGSEDHKKSRNVIERHRKSFIDAFRAGVPVASGSDAGTPYNRFETAPYELVLMVESGMTELEALKAATTSAAALFGVQDRRGSLAEGMLADFVILKDSPLKNIENIMKPAGVCLGGQEVN